MSDYATKQSKLDLDYLAAWSGDEARAWVDSLSLDDRRKLEAEGLLAPLLEKCGSANGCGRDEDAALSVAASSPPPVASAHDSLDAVLADYPHLEAAIEERARRLSGGSDAQEILRKLALLFIDHDRRALNADCLAFVSGLAVRMGESGTSLARKHGISRQAFHKRSSELMKELGLPPSRAMKSIKARESYRASNRRWGCAGRPVNRTSSPQLTSAPKA